MVAAIATIATHFFGYLPFLYIVRGSATKTAAYGFVMALGLAVVAIYRVFLNRKPVAHIDVVTPAVLYAAFAVYVLVSFAVRVSLDSGYNFLNDYHNFSVIVIVSPILVVFAIVGRERKDVVIKVLFLMVSVYLYALIIGILKGDVQLNSSTRQHLFDVSENSADGGQYNNVSYHLGVYCVTSLFLLGRKWHVNAYLIATMIIAFAGILIMGGRGATACTLFCFGFYIINDARKKMHSLRYQIAIILVALGLMVVSVTLLSDIWSNILSTRVAGRFQGADSALGSRSSSFELAAELYLLSPMNFLFGAGINSFPVYTGTMNLGAHPHNVFLELLCEYGTVGFLLFLGTLISILYVRYKHTGSIYGHDQAERIIFLVAVFYTIGSNVSWGVRGMWVLVFYYFLLLPPKKTMSKTRPQAFVLTQVKQGAN